MTVSTVSSHNACSEMFIKVLEVLGTPLHHVIVIFC